MAIEVVSFPIENGGSFHSYVNVYQTVPDHVITGLSKKRETVQETSFCLIMKKHWLVVWNMNYDFPIILRMSSSQLTFTHIFRRGWLKPPTRCHYNFPLDPIKPP